MPQETNLNISPYFDDFDSQSNYYKVLFKPGFPVQARELTTSQSILQNQIEDVGNHLFKEGAVVIPGQLNYNNSYEAVQIDPEYLGVPVSVYLDQIVGNTITGATSGITAKVLEFITDSVSERGNYTLYVQYIDSSTDLSTNKFLDDEVLLTDSSINFATTFISAGEGFSKTIPSESTATGSAMSVGEGVYFLRGYFVDVFDQTLILDQYSDRPSYRIGFNVREEIISSDVDESLNDNAKGFNNYTAPGADRLKITATLTKKVTGDFNDQNFVQIAEVVEGRIKEIRNNTEYNVIAEEFARRTFDESGNYYIKEFVTTVRESLNNGFGNRGLYNSNQLTSQGNVPSDDLMVYKISPGKAYVRGFEVHTRTPVLLDLPKPRTTKTLEDQAINFAFGPSFTVNSVFGAASVGFDTSNYLSMRSDRVGVTSSVAAGKEIGLARIYDFALESGSYDSQYPHLNQWDLNLFDVSLFSDINLNEPVTLSVPTKIQGKTSGAVGFLRHSVSAGAAITAYDVRGDFIVGERLEFNGVDENSRSTRKVTNFKISDFQSVHQPGGAFSANFIPRLRESIGNASITVGDAATGISTITKPGANFVGLTTVGDLVGYTNPALEFQSFGKVQSVTQTQISISGITTVSGLVDGGLPSTTLNVNDLCILETQTSGGSNSGNAANNGSLYSVLPRFNISDVNLSDATLVIRREFAVTITNNSTSSVSTGTDEVFLPFDEERYTLIRSDGRTEILTQDRFQFGSGSTTLIINGLSDGTGNATLVTTIRKDKVTAKTKINNKSNTIIIDKSSQSNSGVGATTLDDGLTYGNYPYGTRVQDDDIILNIPDVVRVFGVYESKNTDDPEAPSMSTTLMSGETSTTNDLIIGEEVIGRDSKTKAKYILRKSDTSINFIYENSTTFSNGEIVDFIDSGVSAVVSNLNNSKSKNITSIFLLDRGQSDQFYDYSTMIRRQGFLPPTKKIIVYFESASYDSADTGDITTVNSYENFDYATEIGGTTFHSCRDMIDARPRVSTYSVSEDVRSPLEFFGRSFDGHQHSSKDILASDESLTIDYSYYLPRKDSVYVNKSGTFYVKQGDPSDVPQLPKSDPQSMNIANITLPPYLYSTREAGVDFISYKGYQMSDIAKLESRIKNLESYTSLTMLEKAAESHFTPDANGLNRFKSGIFVDNFSNLSFQDIGVGVKNSIDDISHVLRPAHYSTSINMEVGTDSTSNQDTQFAPLLGDGVRRTGQTVTLDYTEVTWLDQPFATRTESVTPFLVMFFQGSIKLVPTADQWIDVTQTEPRDIDMGGDTSAMDAVGMEITVDENGNRVGVMPVRWNSWETVNVITTETRGPQVTEVSTNTVTSSRTTGGGRVRAPAAQTTWRTGTLEEYTTFIFRQGGQKRVDENSWIQRGQIPPWFQVEIGSTPGRPGTAPSTTTTNTSQITRTTTSQEVTTNTTREQQRTGTQTIVTEHTETESLGNRIVNREVIHSMRSRNIMFRASRMKPFTQIYAFWDEVDVNQFCFSKLIEIEMTEGVFQVGEEVLGQTQNTMNNFGINPVGEPEISFRVATANHKDGPYDAPTDIYVNNPYNRANTLPSNYSETSDILNVDTFSLADESEAGFSGYISTGMLLFGLTSGASARVTGVRLVTDRLGTLIANYRVPDSRNVALPTFETGRNKLRLTSSPINSKISGTFNTVAEEIFYSQGDLDTTQELTMSTRHTTTSVVDIEPQTRTTSSTSVRTEQESELDVQIINTTTTTTPGTPAVPGNPGEWTGNVIDPLAQSFFVTDETGVFITSVDLFFSEKPTLSTLPVMVQLREVSLGLPSDVILGYSEVDVDPDKVNISDDASVATNVKFEAPVYLEAGREYAIVLLSNSLDYRVWISRLGEIEISTANNPESSQTLVSTQKTLGSLFKSQNASTWTPSQYEDLKLTLYRADFVPQGNCSFFNSDLPQDLESIGSKGITADPLTIRVGLGTTVVDNGLVPGNTISQTGTQATGDFVGFAGSATGALTITNAGVGYTPSASTQAYTGVALTAITGRGVNATADITITNGSVASASISGGGVGYRVGDVLTPLTIGENTLGQGIRLSVNDILGENELIITNVQGEFGLTPSNTLLYTNSVGINTLNVSSGGVYPISPIRVDTDGLHMRVFHRNHGMHSVANLVTLSGIEGDTDPTTVLGTIVRTSTDPISVASTAGFTEFENVGVAASNPGYVRIGSEIISYTGLNNNTLTGVTRGVDGTQARRYDVNDLVHKYEMNGVSLRRINRTHELNFSTVDDPIGLDYYTIKIDMDTTTGTDRTGVSGFPELHFNEKFQGGGVNSKGQYNVQYEIARPNVNTITPTGTTIQTQMRTVSGTSISGSETSFRDRGFQPVALDKQNFFDTPRIIASNVNSNNFLSELPKNKSLQMNFDLATSDTRLSPVIDLDHTAMVLVTNRVNQATTDYIADFDVKTIRDDKNSFYYVTNNIAIENPATSLTIYLDGYIHSEADLRAFYSVDQIAAVTDTIFTPFPGSKNVEPNGVVLNTSLNNGGPDVPTPKVDSYVQIPDSTQFREYKFTIDRVNPFSSFRIKLIGTSTNQAVPPMIKNLRVIAYA